ncbi:endonuclease/exonuclease/phosphatase family protein [Pedobacter sp. BS3]|uniref:endonuclease/exonuclease/phosphatase family protein n=1 Tax=Pedobacter sp. BS3 TaxID=2567937 RepID=UPI0011EEB638|nr:endonuclease/exonuclease/phosphatase family protein [Pedobacter sp. BS3]TZF84594.1 endonuclease/exonuclease/phosphatase family protein [Pedobacter sp. BS3]
MKYKCLIPVLFVLLCACGKKRESDGIIGSPVNKQQPAGNNWLSPLKIASYNIEYNHDAKVTDNYWVNRKGMVKSMFDKYVFDIAGVQEPYYSQLQDMTALLPGYAYVGKSVYGNTTVDKQLTVNIFYKKSRVEVAKWDSFWFSDTPTIPGIAWGAGQWRICTWAFVKDRQTGKRFYFFSVHLDFTGTEARTKSVALLLDTIPVISKGYPAVLTGDFNFSQHQQFYPQITAGNILKDTYALTSNRTNGIRGTFNNYDPARTDDSRIDHVFVTTTAPVKVNSWAILTDSFNGKFPSDHFPVSVELSFSTQ